MRTPKHTRLVVVFSIINTRSLPASRAPRRWQVFLGMHHDTPSRVSTATRVVQSTESVASSHEGSFEGINWYVSPLPENRAATAGTYDHDKVMLVSRVKRRLDTHPNPPLRSQFLEYIDGEGSEDADFEGVNQFLREAHCESGIFEGTDAGSTQGECRLQPTFKSACGGLFLT